jgi:hypothetical protein
MICGIIFIVLSSLIDGAEYDESRIIITLCSCWLAYEQFEMDIIKNKLNDFEINKNNLDNSLSKNRVFFNLRKHSLIQKVLINTLLIRNNCFIDDLAKILRTDAKKLHRVWQGHDKLTGKKSTELISLFYILSN